MLLDRFGDLFRSRLTGVQIIGIVLAIASTILNVYRVQLPVPIVENLYDVLSSWCYLLWCLCIITQGISKTRFVNTLAMFNAIVIFVLLIKEYEFNPTKHYYSDWTIIIAGAVACFWYLVHPMYITDTNGDRNRRVGKQADQHHKKFTPSRHVNMDGVERDQD